MLQNRFLFNQSSVSLEIIGLPDYSNDEIITKSLLTLSLCISNQGYQKLKSFLSDF